MQIMAKTHKQSHIFLRLCMVSSPNGSSSNMAIPQVTTTFLALFDAIVLPGYLLVRVNHRGESHSCDAVYSAR